MNLWMMRILVMEKDINETLLLNGVRKPDGSIRDTSTEILKADGILTTEHDK